MRRSLSKNTILIIAGSVTVAFDQLTKFFVSKIQLSDPSTHSYHIISFFEKIYGSAGLHLFFINVRHYFELNQLFIRLILLPCIGAYIAYYVISKKVSKASIFLGLGLLGGALAGNAIDILFRGYVVDWIGYSAFVSDFELNFAINYADIAAIASFPLVLIGLRKKDHAVVQSIKDASSVMSVTRDNRAA